MVSRGSYRSIESDEPFDPGSVVSANAYLGADPIVDAITRGADVVITGRVADPSLFVAPILTVFGGPPTIGRASGRRRLPAICSNAPGR
jgi:Acyclic terpene utilisation family protein AtuA